MTKYPNTRTKKINFILNGLKKRKIERQFWYLHLFLIESRRITCHGYAKNGVNYSIQ